MAIVKAALENDALQIFTATDPEDGLKLFLEEHPRIVLLDLLMPKLGGMEVLDRILTADPAAEVILITGEYSTESAVEAIKKGACDYLEKPIDIRKLRSRVEGLIGQAEARKKTFELDKKLTDAFQFEGIVGRSPLMLDLFSVIRRIAPHFNSVLITGETGTGKELVANALHQLIPARSGRFVVCNSSAIVETLIESELFGHVRGAFTGATQDKMGLFEYANGGTIFLDEIGELPLAAQAKLLRVLEKQEIQRVGSPATRSVNIRVLAATNRDLRGMITAGKFREDLFYRLSMVEIKVPSLLERMEDLPLLQRYFLRQFSSQYKKNVAGLTRRAQICLTRYSWPGNVRELKNVIGNACMMAEKEVIDLCDLPKSITAGETVRPNGLLSFEELQRQHLLRVLERVGGNKVRAAEILGVSRGTVYEMLSKAERNHIDSKDENAS